MNDNSVLTASDAGRTKVAPNSTWVKYNFLPLENAPEDHLFNPWWEAILAAYEYGQVGRHEATRLLETMGNRLEAMARAKKIEAAMFDFLLKTRHDPFIKVMGSASDNAANADYSAPAKAVLEKLLERTVPRGLCLGNGGARTGFMGYSSRCFEEVRERLGGVDLSLNPRLAVVPLLPRNPETWREPKFTPSRPCDLSSPPQMLFQTRTPLLFGFGQVLAVFFFAGGFGTREEESFSDLGVQLRDDICTTYTHMLDPKLLPPMIYLDEHCGVEWEWEARVGYFERILRKRTAKRASFQPFYVLRPCEPPSESPRTGYLARAREFFTVTEDSVGQFFGEEAPDHPVVQDWHNSGARVVYGSPDALAAFAHRLLVERYRMLEATYGEWAAK